MKTEALPGPEAMIFALGQSLPQLQELKAAVDRITGVLHAPESERVEN